ncbi:MAG: NAD(P)H-binding protein [Candidatus Thiodiazotropha sp. (ex Dulcina madagascariensis)]|nr:NAD(P)H-binding protein [Candidatus Thiodiazotropha sp. (ex Dulcina madagascariensis)]MCU7925218.1 NAD(P)H-binding protein [Candidatus Thiodiazotropha sp. (ex Dulcina madagascariensis)]
MRILITGATGFIGSHIMRTLLLDGHQVVGCTRHPGTVMPHHPNAAFIQADYATDHAVADWLPRVSDMDIVINAVGIIREQGNQTFASLHTKGPIALFRACEKAGVKKVIQISALGADDTAFSQYHLSKKAADDHLATLALNWLVLMPSIVYGEGAKSMAFFKAIAGLPWIPLVDRGDQPIQPIHISDLTKLISGVVKSPSALKKRCEIVGPAPITMKALYTKLREWLGLGSPRFFSIPYPVALRLARWGRFLGSTPMTDETVAMLRKGNTGDVGQFVDQTWDLPKSIDQRLIDTPSQDSDRWHAGLYFLRPALRLSIAFVWLFTGFISAFAVPTETSYAMLAKTGISGVFAPLMLYGAAATDILLGIAVLIRYRMTLSGWTQISLILLYTLIISISQPEQWLHPFGPVTKNAPLIMAILIMMVLEKRQ